MAPLNVLMVGSGEYTTGMVNDSASTSDKKIGVVALTMFDLRRRGKVGQCSIVGVSGTRFPGIRKHFQKNISEAYNNLDVTFQSFPADDKRDPDAYKTAIDALEKGSAITIFTPDSTHFPIALYAIERGHHVLITKPATQLLSHHLQLLEAAKTHGVFVFVEHHKRFDPAYADARHKANTQLGDFNYFYSYMSQPKSQLETFKAWADMASKGEVRINQAKRGYDVASDESFSWLNPFYMKYAPDEEGNFNGQTGYGYISFEKFVDAVNALKDGKVTLEELDKRPLPTLANTVLTTAILEAGRRSLDEGRSIEIVNTDGKWNLK
ncbi:putative nad binding rossmann fold [Phaeomoniella chlamydospora]|uniref:Putative nad binding rossmann fold n=1 Tax=Phaeomoniella chlamydospora TaxID=158046 RepID=A0A0G2ERD9_PHACM|nr:putative nad binding rossmann fold [Phaeomoniella chlamydospora]